MKGTITIAIPMQASAKDLRLLGSIFSALERGRFLWLANALEHMNHERAEWSEPTVALLGQVAAELRAAARGA